MALKRKRTSALATALATATASKSDLELSLEADLFGFSLPLPLPLPSLPLPSDSPLPAEDGQLFFIDASSGGASSAKASITAPNTAPNTAKASPLWTDSTPAVDISAHPKLRKLRKTPLKAALSGDKYQTRLREKFEALHPRPAWASKSSSLPEESLPTPSVDWRKKGRLTSDEDKLAITRMRPLQSPGGHGGSVSALAFHPTQSVLLSCQDRRATLHSIDGFQNPPLQSFEWPDLSVMNAAFDGLGENALFFGNRPFFYSVSLREGKVVRHLVDRSGKAAVSSSLQNARVSPSPSSPSPSTSTSASASPSPSPSPATIIANPAKGGLIQLFAFNPQGGTALVGTLKAPLTIVSLEWDASGLLLRALSERGTVFEFDVAARRCVASWQDQGAYGSLLISNFGAAGVAIGSKTGILNLYSEAGRSGPNPQPKVIGNLTTAITLACPHPSLPLLLFASKKKKDALRIVNTDTGRVVKNWPTSSTPLGKVSAAAWKATPSGHWLVLGQISGAIGVYKMD